MGYIVNLIEVNKTHYGMLFADGLDFDISHYPTIFTTKEELEIELYKWKRDVMNMHKKFNGNDKKTKRRYWKKYKIVKEEVISEFELDGASFILDEQTYEERLTGDPRCGCHFLYVGDCDTDTPKVCIEYYGVRKVWRVKDEK